MMLGIFSCISSLEKCPVKSLAIFKVGYLFDIELDKVFQINITFVIFQFFLYNNHPSRWGGMLRTFSSVYLAICISLEKFIVVKF